TFHRESPDSKFWFLVIGHGMGMHAEALPTGNLMMIVKLLVAYEFVYCTTVGIVKISIFLMYARIFLTRSFCIATYILGSIVISWVIAIFCVSVFQCTPIAKAWNTSFPGTCINLKDSFVGNAVPNILTDIAILSLPMRDVWGLQTTLVHRLTVIAVFFAGQFVCSPFPRRHILPRCQRSILTNLLNSVIFTSAYRFSTLFQFQPTDTSWTLAEACTLCRIETSSGIISACIPTLRPLFVMLSSKFGSHPGTSRTRTADGKASGLQSFAADGTALRPANESLSKTRVQLHVSQNDSLGDEVPLNTTVVTRVQWQETTFDGTRKW
ncbi:uncharacterized protein N7498_010380, partial [Penicillium cinerascens]